MRSMKDILDNNNVRALEDTHSLLIINSNNNINTNSNIKLINNYNDKEKNWSSKSHRNK